MNSLGASDFAIAIDQECNLVGVGDFDAQAEQVFADLKRVLDAGGSAT